MDRTFYSLSDSKFTRHYREEVDMVFSGMDCILNGERAIYASTELTSGLRLYTALREYKLKTSVELKERKGKEWFTAHIWNPNVESAAAFAREVRGIVRDHTMVLTPAPFTAPGWSQPEYLAFWEQLVRTRIKATWFNRNWQFSNGCTFEFAVSVDAGVPTLDHAGKVLEPHHGIQLIESAIGTLEAEGFDTTKLRENLRYLQPVAAHGGKPFSA